MLQAEERRLKSVAILVNLARVRAYSQVRAKQRKEPGPIAE